MRVSHATRRRSPRDTQPVVVVTLAAVLLALAAPAAAAAPPVTVDSEPRRYTRAEQGFLVAPSAQVDHDTPLRGAAVTLGEGAVMGEDELAAEGLLPSGISAAPFDGATGTLSLSGIASGADYEAALRTITYRNTSSTPTERERGIALTVHDGVASGPPGIARIIVARRVPARPIVTSSPSGPDPNSTATFVFQGEPGAAFTCSLDGEPEYTCTSPVRIENLVPGTHGFRIRQVLDGNVSEPAGGEWVYAPPGGTPPDVTVVFGPRAVLDPFTTVFVAAGKPFSTRCRLRVGTSESCGITMRTGAYAIAAAGSAGVRGSDGWITVPLALTPAGRSELTAHPFGLGLQVRAVASGVGVPIAEGVGLLVLFDTLRPTLKLSRLFAAGGGSARVTAAGRGYLSAMARDIARLTRIRCVVSGRDRKLAQRRARAVCAVLRAVAPRVAYTSTGIRSSPRKARVAFELTTP